jgi:hypothetical protein
MCRDIHALVQDPNDVDALVCRDVENEMLSRRVDPKALIHFIVASSETGAFCERFERAVQSA